MQIIQTGTKYKVFDESIRTYEALPAGTYLLCYQQQEGCFLIKRRDIVITEKTYGVHAAKLQKVMQSFRSFDRSLGVILSGDKGIGKSLFAKMLCIEAVNRGIPVIVVENCVPGVSQFIDSISQECIVLFDEFDKTYGSTDDSDDQAALLSLFDGTAGGKKMFIVTCNELWGLNDYLVNRPGRFHYHFRFEYPEAEDIREYLEDKLLPEYYSQIDDVITFSRRISLNYDCLRSIAFELNLGQKFSEAVSDLNIMNTSREEYNITLYTNTGQCFYNYRYRTNLYDNDGEMDWIVIFNGSGSRVGGLYFDKSMILFDTMRGTTVIPAEGLRIVWDDNDDTSTEKHRKIKPEYLTIEKCGTKNLHYVV